MDYKTIDQHMKNKFKSNDKIKVLDNLTDNKINEIKDTQIFKARFTVLAIDIVGSKKLNDFLDVEIYNKLISEFVYGTSSIMSNFDALWIKIQGDMVYCIFNAKTQEEIGKAFNVSCYLNTFMDHLNKNFKKFLKNQIIKAGIGLWFSFENYITKVGKSGKREIVFLGEAVNKACTLASYANREGKSRILFNNLVYTNFTTEDQSTNSKIGSFTNYTFRELSDKPIKGCNWIIKNYENFVKNNV